MSKKRDKPILIVDDEAAIRQYHIASLGRDDFPNILQAGNGLEAWEIFQNTTEIPLVMTDVEMPEKDGIWLLNKIRETKPATQIVIVSGLTGNSVSIHSTRGNISYLPKPVAQIYLSLAAKAAYDRYTEALWVDKMRRLSLGGKESWDHEAIAACLEQSPWQKNN
ncbi:MAG: response regulator [Desulfobulbaceae bacterium]|nr:response regulator [Desulfobulbaceae bacterium]